MAGYKGAGGRPARVALTGFVALALALAPVTAGAEELAGPPPDELHPPVPGEAAYPDDPSEPAATATLDAGFHAASYAAPGERFRSQELTVLSGSNRFLTGVATSQAGWPDGASSVVLASGENYLDALASSTLAGVVDAPLLITPVANLDSGVEAELQRLRPDIVYLVGGLAPAVEDRVAAFGVDVRLVTTSTRYGIGYAVARAVADLGWTSDTVFVASGDAYPDALAASAIAAGRQVPILYAPSDGSGRKELHEQVAELGAKQVWVVGGPAAVPDETVDGLPGVTRLAGRDRTETAAVLASHALSLGMDGTPVLAAAHDYPDGLTGGVYAGVAANAPVLLTHREQVGGHTYRWLDAKKARRTTVVGGSAAVSPFALCQLRAGDSRAFVCVEEELTRQGYHVGAVDGRIDEQTVWAFYAFQKVAQLPVTGRFGEADVLRMLERPRIAVGRPDLPPDHVEINIARQLVLVVRGGEVVHALHTSTGKPSTPTVRGVFTVYEKRNYRQTHNDMYRPVFFYRGYAFHGYPSVPLYAASAGCARMWDGDMNFLWNHLPHGHKIASY